MSPVEKFADDAFRVACEDILARSAAQRLRVLGRVSRTGNSGAYVPALVELKKKQVREMILARSFADIEAHTLHHKPCGLRAEQSFEQSAMQIAGGAVSALHGQLHLMETRTKRPINILAGYLEREIGAGKQSAVNEGLLNMRRQRLTFENANRLSLPIVPAETRVRSSEAATRGVRVANNESPASDQVQNTAEPSRVSTRRPRRRSARYEAIDQALCRIAKSKPDSHREVFQALDGRAKVPNASPFRLADSQSGAPHDEARGTRRARRGEQ